MADSGGFTGVSGGGGGGVSCWSVFEARGAGLKLSRPCVRRKPRGEVSWSEGGGALTREPAAESLEQRV